MVTTKNIYLQCPTGVLRQTLLVHWLLSNESLCCSKHGSDSLRKLMSKKLAHLELSKFRKVQFPLMKLVYKSTGFVDRVTFDPKLIIVQDVVNSSSSGNRDGLKTAAKPQNIDTKEALSITVIYDNSGQESMKKSVRARNNCGRTLNTAMKMKKSM